MGVGRQAIREGVPLDAAFTSLAPFFLPCAWYSRISAPSLSPFQSLPPLPSCLFHIPPLYPPLSPILPPPLSAPLSSPHCSPPHSLPLHPPLSVSPRCNGYGRTTRRTAGHLCLCFVLAPLPSPTTSPRAEMTSTFGHAVTRWGSRWRQEGRWDRGSVSEGKGRSHPGAGAVGCWCFMEGGGCECWWLVEVVGWPGHGTKRVASIRQDCEGNGGSVEDRSSQIFAMQHAVE